jgi:hypothetical protein
MRLVMDIPENLERELIRDSVIQNEEDLKIYVAAKMYESGFLSARACGMLVGVDTGMDFMKKANKFGVGYGSGMTADEIVRDIENAAKFAK